MGRIDVGRAAWTGRLQMTDVGSLFPHPDCSGPSDRQRVLNQIAAALALPVTAFTDRHGPSETSCPSSAECANALAAFSRIEDAEVRAFCLRLLESLGRR